MPESVCLSPALCASFGILFLTCYVQSGLHPGLLSDIKLEFPSLHVMKMSVLTQATNEVPMPACKRREGGEKGRALSPTCIPEFIDQAFF